MTFLQEIQILKEKHQHSWRVECDRQDAEMKGWSLLTHGQRNERNDNNIASVIFGRRELRQRRFA